MSKSWKSHGRGGLRRHIQMRPTRQGHGYSRNKASQGASGAFGIEYIAPVAEVRYTVDQTGEAPARETPPNGWVSLAALKERVVQPGIERHLRPLQLYRGHADIGRIRRLWNYVQLMHLAGVQSASAGLKLFGTIDNAHLLGPVKRPPLLSLDTFLSRMHDHLEVAALIPGLPDYIKEQIAFRKFNLTKISVADPSSRIEWRREAGLAEKRAAFKLRVPKPTVQETFYPYMLHDPQNDESALVLAVSRAVPRGLDPRLRADVCQEMLLAILTGEISKDQIHSKRSEMIKRVMKMNGISDRALSLDATMPGSTKTLIELLAETEWVDPLEDANEDQEVGFSDYTDNEYYTDYDEKLRVARRLAHEAFDRRWWAESRSRLEIRQAKEDAYAWLAAQLGISRGQCHIGNFDIPTCHRVINLCEHEEAESDA